MDLNRRRCLTMIAASAVPLAGCSSGDGDGANGSPDTNDTPPDNSTDGSIDEPTDGNTTDPSDDGNSSDGDGGDGGSDGDGDGGPTEEELAQEAVAAAQTALSDAVSRLESEGTTYGSLSDPGDQGPPVTAAVDSLSAGPVRDQLASVQTEVDAAREHDLTSDQEAVLGSIETAKNWIHSLLDAYQPLHDLYLEAHYAVQDHLAEDSEPDLQAVRRAADQAQSPVDEVTDPYNAIENADVLEAISRAGFEAQRDRLATELSAGSAIPDAVESIEAGEEIFWPAHEIGLEDEYGEDPQLGVYEDAQEQYEAAVGAADVPAGSLGAATDYCACYAGNMATAAEEYEFANDAYKAGESDWQDHRDTAEAAISDAESCSFDWSA